MFRRRMVDACSPSGGFDDQALVGGNKPSVQAPTHELMLKSSGGVYPRLYWVPVYRNFSYSMILFGGFRFWPPAD